MTQLDVVIPESVLSITPEFKRLARKQIAEDYGVQALRALAKMLGSERGQEMTFYRSAILSAVHTEANKFELSKSLLLDMRNMTRRQAFRLLSTLPIPLLPFAPTDLQEREFGKEHEYWFGIAIWLLMDEMELRSAFEPVAQNHFGYYKLRAELSFSRFKLIEELISLGVFDRAIFPKAGLLWILSEAAICRRRMYMADVPGSKREQYEHQAEYIRKLKDKINPPEATTLDSFEDKLIHFDKMIEGYAYRVASENKGSNEFNDRYFSPYLKLKSKWNVAESKSNMKPIRKHDQRTTKPKRRNVTDC